MNYIRMLIYTFQFHLLRYMFLTIKIIEIIQLSFSLSSLDVLYLFSF